MPAKRKWKQGTLDGSALPQEEQPASSKKKKVPKRGPVAGGIEIMSPFAIPGTLQQDMPLNPDSGDCVRELGASIACLRCSTVSVPAVTVPLSVMSCTDCYKPMPAFHPLGLSYIQVCGQCNADPAFNEDYSKAIEVHDLPVEARPYPREGVSTRRENGYEVFANFVAKSNTDMTIEDTHGMNASDLSTPTVELLSPLGGSMKDMIVTKDESQPFSANKNVWPCYREPGNR